jgi:D-3-phosphoglycerate dehydrogenase
LKILVTGADLAPEAQAILRDFELVYAGRAPSEDDLVTLCAEHQPVAMIVRYGRITQRIIRACASLRVISKHGSGTDTIDIEAAAARGIAVKAAAGANAAAVAEHTWALILACAKSIPQLDERMHGGHWDKATHKSLELNGKTLGLIGIGAIGERVAAVGLAFGMQVVAYDPFVRSAPAGIVLCDLANVVRQADVLSLHCPLTRENRNVINSEMLALMPRGSILVNTARGGLIEETALIDALKSGHLRAAGLDTFRTEPPPPDLPFRGVPGAILTPHVGGVTSDAYRNMGTAAANNILAVLAETTEEIK